MLDVFNQDAFSALSLTAAINKVDYVPGRAGEVAFAGVGEGVSTTSVVIEEKSEGLSLISTAPRGAPSEQETANKRTARSLSVPHIPADDTVRADEVQNVRAFGSDSALQGVQALVNGRLSKLAARHDLTLENLRLGALKGEITDADGSTIYNLFTEFGVSQEASVNFALGTGTTDVRGKCQTVIRKMRQNAKLAIPSSARVHAFCGDDFFDALLSHANVKGVYDGYAAAERRLGDSYAHGIFEFGGIFFENYRGTDDGSTVGIGTDAVRFFWSGVPGMYAEYYAPADFMETVNTVGLPRYAKVVPDPSGLNRFARIHTQQNPLPLCLRPKTLMVGARA